MADNENPYERAIADLVAKIEERMKPIRDDMRMVNILCGHAKLPPRFPDVETQRTGGSQNFRRDQFFGKPLATVVREYLEIRGPSDRGGLGAATVNEIYDALIAGGYKPETSDEVNAKRGLRIALTKNSAAFYRVPGGAYGLLEWYPNAREQKADDEKPVRTSRKGRRSKAHKIKARRERQPRESEPLSVVESDVDEIEAATTKKVAAA